MHNRPTHLHVINHTHWDREWFVPFTFTRRWIPRLIDNLDKVVAKNPKYKFLFDAQTMVIEDLEAIDAESYAKACRLIKNKNLEIGPYYAQIDNRMSGGESLVRNMRIGIDKTKQLGGATDFVAWDVDIFGHVSQSPQIHSLFGITNVYLWRGPGRLEPFFWWKGPDDTTMLAIDLFAGGYRNFYRVTTIDRLALPRLEHEARKLRPYYPSGHIPVFDGFDLDSEPGDAGSYFASRHAKELADKNIRVVNASPLEFATDIRGIVPELPTLSGEHLSGKYTTVYPGNLSVRTYAKLEIGRAERLLYRYAEPLSTLLPADAYPEDLFTEQVKDIEQNLVHDVIGGCSIDQVHQMAELRTQRLDKALKTQTTEVLSAIGGSLKDGLYAYMPATGNTDVQIAHEGRLYNVAGRGVSIAKIDNPTMLPTKTRKVSTFTWKNKHFQATVQADGSLTLGNAGQFGQLVVRDEAGDTYWDEPSGAVKPLVIDGQLAVLHETNTFAQIAYTAAIQTAEYSARALVTLTFDESALPKWHITLSTTGTGFSVLLRHSYKEKAPKLNVGMQFDNVERPFEDTDLLPRELDPAFTAVLNASSQRDLVKTFTFPFHSYISPATPKNKVHLLAKSLKAYQTEQPGHIDLMLARAVDWLMKPSHHKYHTGDAGPKLYVPDARAERETSIECALLVSDTNPDDIDFHQAVDQYLHTPLLFRVNRSHGTDSQVRLFDEPIVISSIHRYKGKKQARVYNPTSKELPFGHKYTVLAQDNHEDSASGILAPKAIRSLLLESQNDRPAVSPANISILNWPEYPVGPDTSKPDPEMIAQLTTMYQELQKELDVLTASLEKQGANAPHSLQHKYYVVARECMEARLSLLWNERRTKQPSVLTEKYVTGSSKNLYELAVHYNDLRVMRRMYDYIIGIDANDVTIARPAPAKTTDTESGAPTA